jgi:lysophospholipase L1-like esterase
MYKFCLKLVLFLCILMMFSQNIFSPSNKTDKIISNTFFSGGNQMFQNTIAKQMEKVVAGTPVVIDCWGDSTMLGWYMPEDRQATIPPPAMLQNILRAYYGNTAITVLNNGVNGDWAGSRVLTWDADMAASPGDIIIINYCINDRYLGADPDAYHENLITMVDIARNHGKIVVFNTPNLVLNITQQANMVKAEGIKHFAQIMRQVATEYNVPLVDIYEITEKYFQNGGDVMASLTDGLHPSEDFYKYKGLQMAQPFIYPGIQKINSPAIIPITSPGVLYSGAANTTVITPASITGRGVIANSVRIPIFIDSAGMDIYLAITRWASGSDQATLKYDGDIISNIVNCGYSTYNGDTYAIDSEFMIVENAKPGFHLIEFTGQDNENIGVYYVRTVPTKKIETVSTSGLTSILRKNVLEDFSITTVNTMSNHILLDIPTSNLIKPLDVEITANLQTYEGFVLFCNKIGPNYGNDPIGGIHIYLAANGFVYVQQGDTTSAYNGNTQIGNVDLRGVEHKYRFVVSTNGILTIYIDGLSIGTFTTTKPMFSGFLGFWKWGTGTMTVDKVMIN